MLYFWQCLKASSRVVCKISNKLLLVQQSAISLVQLIRQIPVKESYERSDAFRKEIVHEFLVEGNSRRVDGISAATKRDYAGPRDRESVGLCASLLEELDVFCSAVVGVAGYRARGPICNFTWDGTESIPDGWSTAISSGCTFDLIAIRVYISMSF
jgi:hypothetical protein